VRVSRVAGLTVVALGVSSLLPAQAQWSLDPRAKARVLASDNIGFVSEAQAQSDIVSVIAPGFDLEHESDRFNVDLDYTLQAILYQEADDANEIFHQFSGHVDSEVVRDHLFLTADAGYFQQVADPEQPFIQNNIALNGNRTDTWRTDLGALWVQNIGDAAALSVSANTGVLDFEDDGLLSSRYTGGRFELASPERGGGVTWALRGDIDRIEYDDPVPEAEFSTLTAELGYWVGNNVRTFATGGVESDFLAHRDRIEYDVNTWSVGFDWNVADRDQLTATYGNRVFGRTFNFRWDHKLRDSFRFNITYTEQPSTNALLARRQPLVPGPGSVVDFRDDVGLDRPSDFDVFVAKRLSGGVTIIGNKVRASIQGFTEDRSDRIGADGERIEQDEQAYGARGTFRFEAGVHTTLLARASWEESEFVSGVKTERITMSAELRYQLGRRTDLSLEVQRFEGRNNADEFIENRVGIAIDRRFD
jgi:uncharacterized protein (PEP-CTERM system associated)